MNTPTETASTKRVLNSLDALQLLTISPWSFVNDVHEHAVEYGIVDGRPVFSTEKLKFNGQLGGLVEVVEEETSVPVVVGENEKKEFTLTYIRTHRKSPTTGIHSRYSNFNQKFRRTFPDVDPVTYTQKLRDEGVVVIRPCRGGAVLFERTPDLEEVLLNERRSHHPAAESYDYPAKNAWRERWMNFLKRHLNVTEETTVLFLPGPEALEVAGYNRLGIKREQLIGVERHRKTAENIHRLGLDIQVVPDDVLHYFKTTDQRFDAVLLDYDGKITPDKVEALEVLVGRQLLKERSCLGINVFGRREEDENKMLYLNPFTVDDYQSLKEAGMVSGDNVPAEVLQWENNYDGLRNYGLTGIALRLLFGQDATAVNERLLKKLSRDSQRRWEDQLATRPPQTSVDFLPVNEAIRYEVMQEIQKGVIQPTVPHEKINRKTLSRAAILLDAMTSQPYFVSHQERYLYGTSNGTVNVFYSDFFALDQHTELHQQMAKGILSPFLRGSHRVQNLVSAYHRLSDQERGKVDQHLRQSVEKLRIPYSTLFISEQTTPRRFWVGDAPTVEVPTETKRYIAGLLDDGLADQYILRTFPEAQRSLPAIKAAHRRGAYAHTIQQHQ